MTKSRLIVIDSNNYKSKVTRLIKNEIKDNTLIYLTSNHTYKNLTQSMKKSKINTNKMFFVDCVTKRILKVDDEDKIENCVFLDSPSGITTISIALNKVAKIIPGSRVLIVDSLSSLMIYNQDQVISKFSSFIINKMKDLKVGTVLLVLHSDADKKAIKVISSYVDEVIQ